MQIPEPSSLSLVARRTGSSLETTVAECSCSIPRGRFEGYFEERHHEEMQHGGGLRPDRIDSLGRKYGMRLDGI